MLETYTAPQPNEISGHNNFHMVFLALRKIDEANLLSADLSEIEGNIHTGTVRLEQVSYYLKAAQLCPKWADFLTTEIDWIRQTIYPVQDDMEKVNNSMTIFIGQMIHVGLLQESEKAEKTEEIKREAIEQDKKNLPTRQRYATVIHEAFLKFEPYTNADVLAQLSD